MPYVRAAILLALLALPGLPVAGAGASDGAAASAALADLTDDVWARTLAERIDLRLRYGLPIEKLPDPSLAAMQADAAFARTVLERLTAIDPDQLTHEEWLTHRLLAWQAERAVAAPALYWHLFQVTPYSSPLVAIGQAFAALPLETADDAAAYLDLLGRVPGVAGGLAAHLEGQRLRGVVLPRPAIPAVVALHRVWAAPAAAHPLRVAPERLAALDDDRATAFAAAVDRLIDHQVAPAFAALAAQLESEDYHRAAPETVGVGQYPGGDRVYRELVRLHTGLDLEPVEIHRRGLEAVARIEERMAEVRRALGFSGTREELHHLLQTDPRFLAATPEEVAERLMAPVRRIEPRIAELFAATPEAPYGVRRLDPALEGALTFGYYQWPTPERPRGDYLYNGSDLDQRPLVNAAALVYHELVPGHHFQIARQAEAGHLPELRKNLFDTAFVEGWAEYASELAGEIGMYDDPYDHYGRLAMDAFLSSRLVVDTGMNALGWSRERAIEFLDRHTLESATQIATETLRYAVDMPGQALAYKIGAQTIGALRQRAEERLGDGFDIRRFHEAVLASGSLPMGLLEEHVEWWIERQLERTE